LADVDAGSDTPSLVGKVLKWRRERPEEGDQHLQGGAYLEKLRFPCYAAVSPRKLRSFGPNYTEITIEQLSCSGNWKTKPRPI
jgi:hypothetical protein